MGSARARQVIVEVCRANNLMPKDGQGSASAFVEVDFDNQRKQTKTKARDLNPTWNEKLVFNVTDASVLEDEVVEINVYNDKKSTRGSFLGRVKIPCSTLPKEGADSVVGYALDKRSLFSNVRGEIYIRAYYTEESSGQGGKKNRGANAAGKQAEDRQNSATFDSSLDEVLESKPQAQIRYAAQQLTESKKVHHQPGQEVQYTMAAPQRHVHAPADFNLKETNPKLAATARRMSMLHSERTSAYDLVERMEYLYVKVVKARNLLAKDITGSSDPYVLVKVGNVSAKTRVIDKSLNPDWNQVFAFGKDKFQAPLLELIVKDKDTLKDDFLGYFAFEIAEVPTRVPPDSPLAPQWYKLEGKKPGHAGSGPNMGEIMVSVWKGTQADEAFPEAWQSDSGGHPAAKSKVYLSPRLWYLRVNVIEAQDLLLPGDKNRLPDLRVKVQLGFQVGITRASANRSSSPFWNEDLMFVAAEPFEDQLLLTVEDRVSTNKDQVLGRVAIAVGTIERRVDHRQVTSRWYNLERHAVQDKPAEGQPNPNQPPKPKDTSKFMSRVHLRVCLDGGYHVLDESTHYSSDMRPSAKQIWKPAIGVLELGILSGSGLLPMKTREQRGTTDAYVVAKYGQKWVRSRTIVDSFAPRWNEQYTWEVYDPCTVLTVGVFDNSHLNGMNEKGGGPKDGRIGKVRIRLSTLESDRVYAHSYPLLLLQPSGVKKMGELELAVRFSSSSMMNVLACYTRPLLPKMHYLHPLGVAQLETLRNYAMRIVATRLTRAEPPFRTEVVQYMLDVDSNLWSMRKSKANWFRILNVLSGIIAVGRWFSDICRWKNPVTTVLVHFLFLILVWYPELILPTLFLYMFLIGAWHYRFRPRHPPHMDPRLSHADAAGPDELDEEFDNIPTSKPQEIVRARYDRLRAVSGRIQTVLGDMATQGERLHALLSWRDPRATSMFILFCLLAAILLYVTPFRVAAILYGFYVLRHPRFRDKVPGVPMNFFRRLPALSDRML
ncbi:hypothetical protein KP509_19G076300 [Ceratopteris richardii]|uniref:C2 domain-containing protein n=1 Tax=Ceratopteris richardii TaxID=49495 RepID=A0A8T2SQX3_CERRI|nr:hypothetical protein KP509_19G076300 [Ceratopteris richardii]KAH7353039.1 hypothetical protein KP509_19G076300 [Ceratopteris richardii]